LRVTSPTFGVRVCLALERVVWAGFLVLIALQFSTSLEVQFTLPKLLGLRTILPLIVVLWAIRFQLNGIRPIPTSILAAVGVLAAWWTFTTLFAVDLPVAIQGMHGRYNGLLNHLIFVVLFLVVASRAASRQDVEGLLTLFVFALVPVAVYAVVQNLGLDPIVWPNPRPGSTIGHPVPLAAILALATPLALAYLITEIRSLRRWMWAAILLLFLIAIASTLSRGPWAGLIVAVAVVLAAAVDRRMILVRSDPQKAWIRGNGPVGWWVVTAAAVEQGIVELRRKPIREWVRGDARGFTIVAVGIVLVLGLTWPQSVRRLTARMTALAHLRADPSFMNRFVYFTAASRMWLDHPLVGTGFENFGLLYPRYRPVEGEEVPSDELPTMVHNGYLQMAVTNGLPGLAIYLALVSLVVVLVWRTCWRAAVRAPDTVSPREMMIGAAIVGGIAGYLVQDLSGWEEISLSVFFWMLLGAAVSFSTSVSGVPAWRPRAAGRLAGCVAALAVAAAIAALAIPTLRELLADELFFRSQFLDVSRDWPQIEENLTEGFRLQPDNAYYDDAAGVLYLKRLRTSGDRRAYVEAAALLDRAASKNSFDPYILIHRIDLETLALNQRALPGVSPGAAGAVDRLVEMDRNNATVHESVARLRLAEGKADEALVSIRRAQMLRPHHSRYHMIEGDALRSLGNKAGAGDAYRAEAVILANPGDPDWVTAENKLILALYETGRTQDAVGEALTALAQAPSNGVAHTLLGIAYLKMDKVDAARSAFMKALVIDPSSAAARQGIREVEQVAPRSNSK
jgi:O-antigen ligase/Flp pilus assembly protein TadD